MNDDNSFMIFTPPCGTSLSDNELLHLYYCPSIRPWRHARYLGVYADKTVRAIGEINKVADCEINFDTSVVETLNQVNLTAEETSRVLEAARRATSHGWNINSRHRFYLCDEWQSTDYRKVSHGGIQNARMLDLREAFPVGVPATLPEIAHGLSQATWT